MKTLDELGDIAIHAERLIRMRLYLVASVARMRITPESLKEPDLIVMIQQLTLAYQQRPIKARQYFEQIALLAIYGRVRDTLSGWLESCGAGLGEH